MSSSEERLKALASKNGGKEAKGGKGPKMPKLPPLPPPKPPMPPPIKIPLPPPKKKGPPPPGPKLPVIPLVPKKAPKAKAVTRDAELVTVGPDKSKEDEEPPTSKMGNNIKQKFVPECSREFDFWPIFVFLSLSLTSISDEEEEREEEEM